LGSISQEAQVLLRDFQQGDLVGVGSIHVRGVGGSWHYPTPEGAIILTQTCDLVQPTRLTAQLAPLIRLSDPRAREARDGRLPQYVHVPALGDDAFADLAFISTVTKEMLARLNRTTGIPLEADDAIRSFGRAVGRKFSRFPFPDEVTPWLRPLQRVIQSKSQRPNSPLGRVLSDVTGLRLEAVGGWGAQPPYQLVLIVIVRPGTLPIFPQDDDPNVSAMENISHLTCTEIASAILNEAEPESRTRLWVAFGESLAAQCKPAENVPGDVRNAVASFTAEVVSEDEFTYDRVLRTEEIDLDHLSPPPPR
jgi:hypothetical protein